MSLNADEMATILFETTAFIGRARAEDIVHQLQMNGYEIRKVKPKKPKRRWFVDTDGDYWRETAPGSGRFTWYLRFDGSKVGDPKPLYQDCSLEWCEDAWSHFEEVSDPRKWLTRQPPGRWVGR